MSDLRRYRQNMIKAQGSLEHALEARRKYCSNLEDLQAWNASIGFWVEARDKWSRCIHRIMLKTGPPVSYRPKVEQS
jgi:hypothetical protein